MEGSTACVPLIVRFIASDKHPDTDDSQLDTVLYA